ncbi:sensor histidine kinase [Kibdelosporangium persicum]|uniref:sensor histidine kinase n=1 Tax=Kibdelosporangium persicum TaxID=2698649 RepID=UPI001563BDE7|nr:ATP-binding protein [Kibdelosporangium persicum]
MRATTLWALTALPVVWAALTARPTRLAVWEAAAYLAVLAVTVALVRRRPVTALALAIAAWQVCFFSRATVDTTLGAIALAAGIVAIGFLAGRHATTGHQGVVVLVVAMGSAIIGGLVTTGGADTALAAVTGSAVLAVVPWSIGRYRRQYAEMIQAGWDRAELWEREAEQARTRERARLAAEMHDLVGHELAQAALSVGVLEVTATLPAEHREAARAARAGVTAAAERLADAVRLLRAEQEETVESVQDIVDRARRSGLHVDLVADDTGQPDAVIARTIHRVIAESITNAIKHAPGAPVAVRLERAADGFELHVVNGPAHRTPTEAAGSGHGLLGLSERVTLVGGRFDAGPRPGGGFEVSAYLPDKPITTVAPGSYRKHVEQRVRHSARRTVLLAAGISAGVVISVLGYLVFDAATSVLEPADYHRLRIGQTESEVTTVLPARTRVDNPDSRPAPPDGSSCRYYSTHANPFDERRHDLYRLCFRDGVLVGKDLLTAVP